MARIIYPTLQQPVLTDAQEPEAVTESRWHQPWSEPVRFKTAPGLVIALAAASGCYFNPFPIANVGPDVVAIAQLQALSEPVRIKPGLRPELQQTLALVEVAPFPEAVSVDRWLLPLSKPVKLDKQGLLASLQQPSAWDPPGNLPETPSYDKFGFPWSEPVRVKPGLAAAAQREFTVDTIIAPPQLYDRYAYPWSEPVRIKPRLLEGNQQFLAWVQPGNLPESVFYSKFAFQWSEPVRVKPGLPAALNPFLEYGRAEPFPETTIYPKWGYAWSEPVRQKKGLGAPYQLASVIQLSPPTTGNPQFTLKNILVRARMLGPGISSARAYAQPISGSHFEWNADDAGVGITVSSNGINATWSAAGFDHSLRSTNGKSTGKWYAEVRLITGDAPAIGVGTSAANLGGLPGDDAAGWGYLSAIQQTSHAGGGTSVTHPVSNQSDVIGIALDLVAGKIWWSLNGIWITGNPSTGSTPSYSGITGTLYVMAGTADSSFVDNVLRLNPAPYYPLPTGFSYWS